MSAPEEFTPGFHDDIPEPAYHADRNTLSVSGAKTLLKAPRLFKWEQENRVYKNVFEYGSAAHAMVLGVGCELVVHEFDPGKVKSPKATNAWKAQQAECRERDAVLLLPAEHASITLMAESLAMNKTAMELLANGQPEVSAYAEHPDGTRMRCRFDYLGDGYGVDYKSCDDASPTGFARSVANFGYDSQADWYSTVAELNGRPLEAFAFIAQEKAPPCIVEVYELDAEFLERGRRRNARARAIYAECMATGDWSAGYTGKPYNTLTAPRWAHYENEGPE